MMSRLFAVLLGILLSVSAASAQSGIKLRTQLVPDQAMVGQQVTLMVDVLFPGEMVHPPRVTIPSVEGLQIFSFESQATTLSDRIDGQSFIGQRFEFDLYARRPGTLRVPPARITLLDSSGGELGTLSGTEMVLHAVVPPGLDPSGPIVAANDVSLTERWEPATVQVHPGDALTRTATRRAQGIPGLAFSDLPVQVPDGVRAYPEPPVITDSVERGEVTGQRVDRVTYVFERAGTFVLPGIAQPWWNLRNGTASVLAKPARAITVLGTPRSAGIRHAIMPAMAAISLVVALTLALIASRRWRRARPREAAAFESLSRACRNALPRDAYRAWQLWSRLRPDVHADLRLAEELLRLEQSLFGSRVPWDREAAAAFLQRARTARRRGERGRPAPPPSLPALNPNEAGGAEAGAASLYRA